jgi:hypothetical protein
VAQRFSVAASIAETMRVGDGGGGGANDLGGTVGTRNDDKPPLPDSRGSVGWREQGLTISQSLGHVRINRGNSIGANFGSNIGSSSGIGRNTSQGHLIRRLGHGRETVGPDGLPGDGFLPGSPMQTSEPMWTELPDMGAEPELEPLPARLQRSASLSDIPVDRAARNRFEPRQSDSGLPSANRARRA